MNDAEVGGQSFAEPVIGRAFARSGGNVAQDEVSDPHGEERVFARLEP